MGRLDDLVQQSTEDYRSLTVRVPTDVADNLKIKAKKIGISRTKLINELFMSGLEEFQAKYPSNGDSKELQVTAAVPTEADDD